MDSRRHVNMPRGNRGLPFKALRVVLRSGEEFDGIRCEDETSHEHLAVWDTNGDDVLPRLLRWSDVSDVTPIPESPVPESVFERIRPDPPTGGIGEHIRWCIDVPKPRKGALVKLLVSDFETDERRRQLWDFVERTDGVAFHGNRPDVFVNSECGAHIVTLELDDRSAVGDFTQHLIWKLAQMGISSHAPGCQRDIAPDRIDDFKRRWSAHDAAQRGPSRDPSRLNMSWFPSHWELVFTWDAIASRVLRELKNRSDDRSADADAADVLRDAKRLGSPLRFYVLDQLCDEAKRSADEARQAHAAVRARLAQRHADHPREVGRLRHAALAKRELVASAAAAPRAEGGAEHERTSALSLRRAAVEMRLLAAEIHHEEAEMRREDEAGAAQLSLLSARIKRHDDVAAHKVERAFLLVTPAIAPAQNEQLNAVYYRFRFAQPEPRERRRLCAGLLRYILNVGCMPKLCGAYERSNRHRGAVPGGALRNFSDDPIVWKQARDFDELRANFESICPKDSDGVPRGTNAVLNRLSVERLGEVAVCNHKASRSRAEAPTTKDPARVRAMNAAMRAAPMAAKRKRGVAAPSAQPREEER